MKFFEFNHILREGARIDHAEDVIFWEGSTGAKRVIDSIIAVSYTHLTLPTNREV